VSIEQATDIGGTAERPGALRRFVRNPMGMGALGLLVVVLVISLAAPLLAPFDPRTTDLSQVNTGPGSGAYLLGGDRSGRDILSRLIWGGQTTFLGAAIVVIVATLVGVGTGLLAAYAGRIVDTTLTWVSEVLLAIPSLVVLIALFAVLGPNLPVSMLIFGVLVSPFLYRLVRSLAIQVRHEAYVEAAQVAGVPATRILGVHVLRVIRGPIIVMMADIGATGVGIQATLEFLGFGGASSVTWGGMINEAFGQIYLAPLGVVWPGLLLTAVIGSLTILGNAVRDSLVPTAPVARPRAVKAAKAKTEAPATTAEIDPEAILSVRGLTIGYPRGDGEVVPVVRDVSLDVPHGSVVGLVGESGSGKSQTVFSVLDLLPATAEVLGGTIALDGTPATPQRLRALRGDRIAYVPQEPMVNLDPSFTIEHQLAVPLMRKRGLSRAQARRRAIELLESVGIREPERVAKLYPHQISGGMAQRVLIAGAVSCDPDLLIADEPTTALDVTVQAEVLELLREQQRSRSLSILIVTHNFGVVADLCDHVVVMRQGAVVEAGPVERVFASPAHEYTRTLLESTLEDAPYRAPIGGGAQ
jgi:peptide/nickel transport system permease protein